MFNFEKILSQEWYEPSIRDLSRRDAASYSAQDQTTSRQHQRLIKPTSLLRKHIKKPALQKMEAINVCKVLLGGQFEAGGKDILFWNGSYLENLFL